MKRSLVCLLRVLIKFLIASTVVVVLLKQHCRQCRHELEQLAKMAEPVLTLDEQLRADGRILCLIVTDNYRDNIYAKYTERTWAPDCDRAIYVSNNEHFQLEPIVFNTTKRWLKVLNALEYVYTYHVDEADWFLVVRDDNYVVMPNLRYMLYPYSSQEPIYFGYELSEPNSNVTYMHEEAGFVLSKEALHRFVTQALPNEAICQRHGDHHAEQELARCLQHVGVSAGDSRDSDGGLRFLPERLDQVLNSTYMLEHYRELIARSVALFTNGHVRISPHVAVFSRVDYFEHYELKLFLQHMHLFGVPDKLDELPPKRVDDEQVPQQPDTHEHSEQQGKFNNFQLLF